MLGIGRDLRFAVRALRKAPAFAAISILTVALGVGASTAVFSMVNGALLKRLPYAADRRLIRIAQPTSRNPDGRFSVPEIADYRTLPAFAGVAEYHSMPFQFYGRGEPQRVQTGVVSDNFFDLLGVRPIIGRNFVRGEEAVGAPNVILLSHRYWLDQFGGDSSVVGSKFTMNDRVGTIIGVLPPLPVYPDDNDIWMPAGQCPFRSGPAVMSTRTGRMLRAFAVMRPGTSPEAARRQLAGMARSLHTSYPEDYPAASAFGITSLAVRDELTRPARPLLYTLLASAVFVLVIAAANYANLALTRQVRRAHEFALRTALGAARARIFRQLVTESLCVTSAGALLGVGVAYAGLDLLRTFASRVSPRAGEIAIDPAVLGFAVVTSVAVGLIAATMPLWRATVPLSDALRAGAVSTTPGRRDGRTRNLLVALQVAVAFVVLAGAGLMARSLLRLQATDGGYDARNVLTARVDLNWSRYTSPALVRDFAEQLVQRMAAQAGVAAVAVSSDFPLNSGVAALQPFVIRDRPLEAGQQPRTSDVTSVSPDYFKVLGVPLLRGRVFTAADRDTGWVPAVIGRRLADTHWPGADPIGAELSIDQGRRWLTVVGMVGDVRQNGPAQHITDQIYVPFLVSPTSDVRVLVRAVGDPAALVSPVRAAVRALDDRQPIVSVRTLDELRDAHLTQPRVTTILLAVFAAISLVITTGGLAGVVAYSVSQRSAEIGIRIALGAQPGHILWSVARDGALVVAAGLAAGVAAALAATRLIGGLLFEVSAADAATYAAVALLLALIGVVSCLVPARRALRLDPALALRAK